MEVILKTNSKIGVISLILCVISIGLSILTNVIVPNYDIAFPIVCVMVIISITALITAIVALKKDKAKKIISIISIVIASLLILAGGFVLIDRLLAILIQGYFMGDT